MYISKFIFVYDCSIRVIQSFCSAQMFALKLRAIVLNPVSYTSMLGNFVPLRLQDSERLSTKKLLRNGGGLGVVVLCISW